MKKITVTAIALATLLAACGGSDAPAASGTADSTSADTEVVESTPTDTVAVASDSDAGECGLTEEQIGDDTITVLSSYRIADGKLACEATPEAAETFALFQSLVPGDYSDAVVAFVAIDTDQSNGTDGALQDVYDADDNPTGERFIALDVTGSSTELERTIVHEMGHSIFITAASDVPTSYADDFNAAFPPGTAYEDAPDEYVTEYAAKAEDGSEDMAETWAMYVFGGTPFAGDADDDGELDVVEPGTIAAEKVAFWGNYPELVQLREDILAGAGF